MKLIKKLIPALSIGALITTPILTTTSCSCTFELHLTELEQFVYDRTFSIMVGNNGHYSFGTGWIVSDATKGKTDDYVYWLATNWHVINGFLKYGEGNKYYYADNSLTYQSQFVEHTRYKEFSKFYIEELDTSKFTYDPILGDYIPGIDLSVVKVDFGKPEGEIKTKLDNLNACQKQYRAINKFVAADNISIKNKNMATCGYPMKKSGSWFGGQWEAHSFSGKSYLDYCEKNTKYGGNNQFGHKIDETYRDVSPQYIFKESKPADPNFLDGGSSGSMLVTSDYEVVGIYWGGWGTADGKEYYPSYSLFNTSDKNFLADFI